MFRKKSKAEPFPGLTPELKSLIVTAAVEGAGKQEAAAERWRLGGHDRWAADLAVGTISFHFGDQVISGPVQLLGSYSYESGTWLWGWANDSVPASARSASEMVRQLGLSDAALHALAERKLTAPDTFGDDFAAVTVEVAQLAGYYRAPSVTGYIYLGLVDLS